MSTGSPSVLAGEMAAQPEGLARLRDREGARLQRLGARLAARRPRGLLIAARGSSHHAAVYAQYVFGVRARLPVALAAPSLFTMYEADPDLADWAVLAVSQSGASPDVVRVVASARAQGAPTLALTDDGHSDLARAAQEVVPLCVGGERAVAATGTFTASLFALAHLAVGWSGVAADAELDAVPELADRALGPDPGPATIAARIADAEIAYVIGRGFSFPVALEWALKLKEVAGLPAESYSAADYRHGPIAIATEGVPTLLIGPRGRVAEDIAELASELRTRGVELIRVSDADGAHLRFPAGPEWLSPIPSSILGQRLAFELARARGRDPDAPTGLQKVTRTR